MTAGRKLDALIAEKVMHRSPCLNCAGPCDSRCGYHPHYSTDIAAAWEVVEKMRENKDTVFELVRTVGGGYHCTFVMSHLGGPERPYGATAPRAICLAALRAVGHKEEP